MPVIENTIVEGSLTFCFPEGSSSTKYDDWAHYRNQINSAFGGAKAVDILFVDDAVTWLIEVKDYRQHVRTKPSELHDEIAQKVRDTLAGLVSAGLNAGDADERRLARAAIRRNRIRIVLHLEQPITQSKLNPRPLNPANVQTMLKKAVKSVDPHPAVVDHVSQLPSMSWVVNTVRP